MFFESKPWKNDLKRRKRLLIKYNNQESFNNNFDATYNVIEKAIVYSGFIIRKLIDCQSKVSDKADKYALQVESYNPLKEINRINRWADFDTHDWSKPQKNTVQGKDVCNWLIHSYIFQLVFDDKGIVEGFYVTSDFDRNKILYFINLYEWIKYVEFIINDHVVKLEAHYDIKKKDYIYYKKERG